MPEKRLGLGKQQRVRRRLEIQAILQQGQKKISKNITLWIQTDFKAEKKARLGVIVSTKVSRLATQRNIWKRRIREAFRTMQENIRQGTTLMIRARTHKSVPSVVEIQNEIRTILQQENLWE